LQRDDAAQSENVAFFSLSERRPRQVQKMLKKRYPRQTRVFWEPGKNGACLSLWCGRLGCTVQAGRPHHNNVKLRHRRKMDNPPRKALDSEDGRRRISDCCCDSDTWGFCL